MDSKPDQRMAGASSRIVSPDELVEHIIEEIIVNFVSEATLPQIWSIVCACLNREALSQTYKSIVWSWLIKKPEIEVFHEMFLLPWEQTFDLEKLLREIADEKKITVKIEENKQWLYLTNKPKEGNSIGIYPFNLLKFIISRKEKGISGAELSRVSKQDPRSLTSRLSILEKEGLIKKKAADIPGITTNFVIHTKFYESGKHSSKIMDRTAALKDIVDTVKNAKNKIMSSRDLAHELGFTSGFRSMKRFGRMTRNLCSSGHIRVVLVAPRADDSKRATTRAFMYVKDYEFEADTDDDSNDDDVDDDDEEAREEGAAIKDVDADDSADFSLSQHESVKIIDDKVGEIEGDIAVLNSYFPLTSQISEIVRASASAGIPAMDIYNKVTGSKLPWFLRYLSDLKFRDPLSSDNLSAYNIVRAPDAEGRVKFYRYFTQEEYSKLTGATSNEVAGDFSHLSLPDTPSLLRLSLQYSQVIGNGGLELVHCPDGIDRLYWSGVPDPLIRSLYQKQIKANTDILLSTSFVDDGTKKTIAVLKEKLTAAQVKQLDVIRNGATQGVSRGRPKKVSGKQAEKRQKSEKDDKIPNKKAKTATPEVSSETIRVKSEPKYSGRPSSGPIFSEVGGPSNDSSQTAVFETLPKISTKSTKKAVITPKQPAISNDHKFHIDFASFGGSIKATRRKLTLLELIKSSDGLAVMSLALARAVGTNLGVNTSVDFVTLRNDVEYLKQNGHISTYEFKGSSRKDGEEGVIRTLLIDEENRPSDAKIAEFVESCNNATVAKTQTTEPEVVHIPLEFKNIKPPRGFLSTAEKVPALERKLKVVKASKASITFSRDKHQETSSSASSAKKTSAKKSRETKKEDIDPMLSYLSNNTGVKRKVLSKRASSGNKKTEGQQAVRDRKKGSYDSDYLIAFAKAYTVVTSLAPNKMQVDWKAVSHVLGDGGTHEIMRKRWPYVRRQLRFVTLPRIRDAWQRFVSIMVRNGTITYDMLAHSEFKAIYDLWNEHETEDFGEELSLFARHKDNLVDHVFVEQEEDKVVFSALQSSLEKARYVTNIPFTAEVVPTVVKEREFDKMQAILKSIFATNHQDFDSKRSREILKSLGNYFPALKELELSKEIAYLGESSETKFTIPERTWLQFQNRINSEFLEGSSKFLKAFAEVSEAGKGMVLSPMTPDYTIATILHLLVEKKLKSIVVDKTVTKKLSGYFTRNFNRQMLEVDLILAAGEQPLLTNPLPAIPVPLGGPCTRVWIDMNGNLKGTLWKTIISSLISHIYFRPGLNLKDLHDLTRSLLALFELKEALKWLQDKKAVRVEDEGYYVCSGFQTVIG